MKPLIAMAKDNLALVRLLVTELTASRSKKLKALREFVPPANPPANPPDWSMITAGQRTQIVKKDPARGRVPQFDTEVVAAQYGTFAAVLGTPPGASTAVPIMLELLDRYFPDRREQWAPAPLETIPTLGTSLSDDPALAKQP
ncbi:malate:quinone oxidoreductase [Rhodococcus sp. NPDC056743]|uniref:malate:quinone oxidoreductase n=1 Tax=Rhodococcus sp. NPDC056743 TaxID=3345934 RepID=UPI0036730C71